MECSPPERTYHIHPHARLQEARGRAGGLSPRLTRNMLMHFPTVCCTRPTGCCMIALILSCASLESDRGRATLRERKVKDCTRWSDCDCQRRFLSLQEDSIGRPR